MSPSALVVGASLASAGEFVLVLSLRALGCLGRRAAASGGLAEDIHVHPSTANEFPGARLCHKWRWLRNGASHATLSTAGDLGALHSRIVSEAGQPYRLPYVSVGESMTLISRPGKEDIY